MKMGQQWERVTGKDLHDKTDQTNKNASTRVSGKFISACEKAGIPATRRQASKWNMKKGLAFSG